MTGALIMSTFLRPNPRIERNKSNFIISLATWNVRGLNAAEKQQQLGRDCTKYHLNLTCLQETKVAASGDLELSSTQIGAHTTTDCQIYIYRYRLCHCPSTEAICLLMVVRERPRSCLGPSHPLSGWYLLSVQSC